MMHDTMAMKAYFSKLGLEPEIADIYMALQAYGPQTISQLARNSGVERTRIYRLSDMLKNSKLVEVEVGYKREIFKAAPIGNLQLILDEKEKELREMQDELKKLHSAFPHASLSSPLTHIQFYRGVEGNKQMFWNETRAKTEVLGIFYENMQGRVGQAFFNRWVRKSNTQNLHFRGIVGEKFMQTQHSWYKKNRNERLLNWQQKTIASDIFPITHSTITYDDVVAYYNWKDGEVFGIEIYNQEIAAAHCHFFEMLWRMGTKMGDVDVPLGPDAQFAPLDD